MKEQISKLLVAITSAIAALSVTIYLLSDQIPAVTEKYFYRSDYWIGNWSSNIEYTLMANAHEDLTFGTEEKIIVRLISASKSGGIHGDLIADGLCAYEPRTWVFYIDSVKPNYFSFGKTRNFEISFLREGKKVPIAMLRAEINEGTENPDVIVFKKIASAPSLDFPDKIAVARDLVAFEDDVKELDEKCAEYTKEIHKILRKILEENPSLFDQEEIAEDT